MRVGRRARLLVLAVLVVILGAITWHVAVKVSRMSWEHPAAIYTVIVTTYVLSRFVFAAFYRPPREGGVHPTVAIVVPAFNEGEAVVRTIDACFGPGLPA